jgi:hypothetical protein
MNLIDLTHQCQIYRRAWFGPVVDAGSMDIQQLALTDDGKFLFWFNHFSALAPVQ